MRFINKARENYHYRKAMRCFAQANKNLDNKQIWHGWIMSFYRHWEKYNDLLGKRLGII